MANNLLNGPQMVDKPKKPVHISVTEPHRTCMYHFKTGEPKRFYGLDAIEAAVKSGEWVDSPAKVPGHPNYVEPKEPEYKKVVKQGDPETPPHIPPGSVKEPDKRYVSQMNLSELQNQCRRCNIKFGSDMVKKDLRELLANKGVIKSDDSPNAD